MLFNTDTVKNRTTITNHLYAGTVRFFKCGIDDNDENSRWWNNPSHDMNKNCANVNNSPDKRNDHNLF